MSQVAARSITTDSLAAYTLLHTAYSLYVEEKFDSALVLFKESADVFIKEHDSERSAYSLNGVADCLYMKGDFAGAEEFLMRARRIELQSPRQNSAAATRTLQSMGNVYLVHERFREAIDALTRAADNCSRVVPVDSVQLAGIHLLLSNTYLKEGQLENSREHSTRATAILTPRKEHHPFELGQAIFYSGIVEARKSEYDSAIVLMRQSLDVLQSAGRGASILGAQVLLELASSYGYKGEPRQAIEFLDQALAILLKVKADAPIQLPSCYVGLGEQYANVGDYDRAEQMLEQGLRLVRESVGPHHSFVATPLDALANLYLRMGKPAQALERINEAHALRMHSLGANHPSLAYSFERKGDILRALGKRSAALAQYRKAYDIRMAITGNTNRLDIVRLLTLMGAVECERGSYGKADSLLDLALVKGQASSTRSPVQMAAVHQARGELACRQHNFTAALEEFQEALRELAPGFTGKALEANPALAQVCSVREAVAVLAAKGRALRDFCSISQGAPALLVSSLQTYERALEFAAHMRLGFRSEESKLFSEQEHAALSDEAIDLCVRLQTITGDSTYRERAFLLAEGSRAQVLMESLREMQVAHFAGIPDSLLEAERKLTGELTACTIQLDRMAAGLDHTGPERMAALNSQRILLRTRLDSLAAGLQTAYPAYASMQGNVQRGSVRELARKIPTGTAIVEYASGGSSLQMFVLTSTGLELVTRSKPRHLWSDIDGLRTAIETIDQPSYERHAASLYQTLLAPIRKYLTGVQRLVIVPDGPLCYTPFEALLEHAPRTKPQAGSDAERTALPYLIKSFAVEYAYSASFFCSPAVDEQQGTLAPSFAGFAPVFADTEAPAAPVLAARNSSRQSKGHASSAAVRSITVDGQTMDELKYSGEEVQAIGRDFTERGLQAEEFLNEEATEAQFKQRAAHHRFVHVATHGVMNEEHPRLSSLLFAPGAGAGDDGKLYAGETYELSLDADLVVLSSCESGAGKLVKGEGVMAITRGFFFAGARNIVVSLWRVYDRQAATFMKDFYGHILDGDTYAASLRKAKLAMIAQPATCFPAKWAGFVLIGH